MPLRQQIRDAARHRHVLGDGGNPLRGDTHHPPWPLQRVKPALPWALPLLVVVLTNTP